MFMCHSKASKRLLQAISSSFEGLRSRFWPLSLRFLSEMALNFVAPSTLEATRLATPVHHGAQQASKGAGSLPTAAGVAVAALAARGACRKQRKVQRRASTLDQLKQTSA